MLSFTLTFLSFRNSFGLCCSLKVSSCINWSSAKDCLWWFWNEHFYLNKRLPFVLEIFTGFWLFRYCSFYSILLVSSWFQPYMVRYIFANVPWRANSWRDLLSTLNKFLESFLSFLNLGISCRAISQKRS